MIRFFTSICICLFLSLSGCNCDETPVSRICASHADCDVGQNCNDGLCREGKPVCTKGVVEENCLRCTENSDCPVGSRCSRSGLCIPPQCDSDTDCANVCAEQGSELEVCQADPDSGWRQCLTFSCDDDAACSDAFIDIPEGLTAACVARGCRCRNPCGGTCCAGTVCCGEDGNENFGQCIDDPGPCGSFECGLGYTTSADEEGAWSLARCRREGDECACQELPYLDPGINGIQSDLAAAGSGVVIAAYNSTYGDLLVGMGDQDGIEWQWVDGLPLADAESVTGGPTGPRFGISPTGADQGRYPAVAVADNGTIHLVYQNVDQRRLVYARSLCASGCDEGEVCTDVGRCMAPTADCESVCDPGFACLQGRCAEDSRPNNFLIFELDPRGESGFYNAITVDRNGIPHILSAVHRFDNQGIEFAEWRRYDARNDLPDSPQDFGFMDGSLTLDARLITPISVWPCEGGCPEGEVCIGESAQCVVEFDNCDGGCADGEACYAGQCMNEIPAAPRGAEKVVNAFNQIITDGQGRVIGAWHDTLRNRPMLMEPNGRVVDVQVEGGAFLSLAARGADRHLAFIADEKVVYVRALPDGSVATSQVVDNGARQLDNRSELHVLADTALDLAPDGTLTLYWQDASDQTLRFSRKAPGDDLFGEAQVLAGNTLPYEGAYGFSNRTARNAQGAWMSSFRFHLLPEEPDSGVVLFAR